MRWLVLAMLVVGVGCGSDGGGDDSGESGDETAVGGGEEGGDFPDVVDAGPLPEPTFGMTVVPADTFWRGCNKVLDGSCDPDELPYREIFVSGFEIDLREVTNDQFIEFLDENGNVCGQADCMDVTDQDSDVQPKGDGTHTAQAGRGSYPAHEVTWFGARDYCYWEGKRLCTEAEWEKTARGGCELYPNDCENKSPVYPWGNDEPNCDLVVGLDCGIGTRQPVGSLKFGRGPYGNYDMAGNVWEWVSDTYDAEYYELGGKTNPEGANVGDYKVVRGGNFQSTTGLRVSNRGDFGLPQATAKGVGFRCCADLE